MQATKGSTNRSLPRSFVHSLIQLDDQKRLLFPRGPQGMGVLSIHFSSLLCTVLFRVVPFCCLSLCL